VGRRTALARTAEAGLAADVVERLQAPLVDQAPIGGHLDVGAGCPPAPKVDAPLGQVARTRLPQWEARQSPAQVAAPSIRSGEASESFQVAKLLTSPSMMPLISASLGNGSSRTGNILAEERRAA